MVVVVAVSKASSGRAWQSSSSYLSLYSILRKNEFVLVSFFGVFLVNFFFLARFFFLFFCTFFVKNTTTNTFDFRQTHTTKQRSAEVVCVSARVCGVIVV